MVIHAGSADIPLHLICEVLSYFIAFRYYLFLRKSKGDIIDESNRLWIIVAAILGAFAGSRLVGGLENPDEMMKAENVFWYFYMNKTVLGGFLGGLFGVEAVKKIIGETKASGALFTYPMILGLIIGRIGCFSMGVYEETYGIPTHFFTGMNLGDGITRHPVALYEIVFLTVLWLTIFFIEKKYTPQHGARFKIFLFSYCLFRFVCDFIKPAPAVWMGLTTIQLTASAGMAWYYKYILHPKKLFV